jgi:hypothetical protein
MKRNECPSRFALALGISLVLFAGVSSAQWSSRGPAPRLGHTAVLDKTTNKMIVFGGYTSSKDSPTDAHFNDVWYLTSATSNGPNLTWQKAAVAAGPAPNPRAGHSAVLDSTNNRMIIFGGFEGFANPVDNDVWVLENANGVGGTPTWVKLNPSGTPPPARSNHTAVYNPNSNRMIVFGGNNGEDQVSHGAVEFSDVWVLEDANGIGAPTWIPFIAQDTSFIPARDSHTAVYDLTNNRVIIFGGHNTITGMLYSDIWVLFNADDTQSSVCNGVACMNGPLNIPVFPSPRFGHTAVLDPKSNTMHIFGGVSAAGILNDDWAFTETNLLDGGWLQVSPTGTAPLPRYDHTAVYNSSNNRMVIFGGFTAEGLATDTVAGLSDANAQ